MKLKNTLGICMAQSKPSEESAIVTLDKIGMQVAGYYVKGYKSEHRAVGPSPYGDYFGDSMLSRNGRGMWLYPLESNGYLPGDHIGLSAFTDPGKQLTSNYRTEKLPNAALWMPNGHEVVMSFKQKWADRNAGRCVTANGLRYMLTPVPDFVQPWL